MRRLLVGRRALLGVLAVVVVLAVTTLASGSASAVRYYGQYYNVTSGYAGLKATIKTPPSQPGLYPSGETITFAASYVDAVNPSLAWIQIGWSVAKESGVYKGCRRYVEVREPATSYYYVGYGSQLGWNESHSWLVQAMPDSGGKYWHATYDGWSTLAYTFSSGGPWQVDASSETNQLNNQCRAVFSGVQKKTSPTSSWTQFSVATKACTGRFSMISPSHPYSFTTTANGL